MNDEYEWGPWIDHDGEGHPIPNGVYYLARFADGDEYQTIRGSAKPVTTFYGVTVTDFGVGDWHPSWTWEPPFVPIIRYRVRKPRALRQLRELVENLPSPERETT